MPFINAHVDNKNGRMYRKFVFIPNSNIQFKRIKQLLELVAFAWLLHDDLSFSDYNASVQFRHFLFSIRN